MSIIEYQNIEMEVGGEKQHMIKIFAYNKHLNDFIVVTSGEANLVKEVLNNEVEYMTPAEVINTILDLF